MDSIPPACAIHALRSQRTLRPGRLYTESQKERRVDLSDSRRNYRNRFALVPPRRHTRVSMRIASRIGGPSAFVASTFWRQHGELHRALPCPELRRAGPYLKARSYATRMERSHLNATRPTIELRGKTQESGETPNLLETLIFTGRVSSGVNSHGVCG